jgi:glyoxylate/hydroxypyruvate reductase A
MWEYTLSIVMLYTINLHKYSKQQKDNLWKELSGSTIQTTTIGIMGLGSIGQFLAKKFKQLGFNVKGYSNTKKDISDILTFTTDEPIELFLNEVDILISILPLTKITTNIFNKSFFCKMKKNSYFINVGRGAQVVENDLVNAINSKQLESVYLDVFNYEPLEKNHQFWQHPNINITPHIASITKPSSVASQIIENYNRIYQGKELLNKIDLIKGY